MTHGRDPGSSTDIALEFVVLNEYLSAGGGQQQALQRLVDLAVISVSGSDWAAVTAWPRGHEPYSLAASDDVASAVDLLQYETGDGPCLDAVNETDAVVAPDLGQETRWPAFVTAALAGTPARGVVAFHLADQPTRCALNLYSGTAGAFDADAVSIAALFAAHARVMLIHAASADKASNLTQALTTSRQIGAAIGILMNVHKVTADQAFDLLRQSSQNLHRKLRDIAVDVTDTGTLPTERS